MHVGADTAGFGDQQRAGRVILLASSVSALRYDAVKHRQVQHTQIFSLYGLPPVYLVGILRLRRRDMLNLGFREHRRIVAR
jgi:hypothetical protein